MDIDIWAWVNLSLRWLHLVAGIAWIGASFYFIWLDNSLEPPKDKKKGVGGELWAVHGGGFYHNQKYLVAPDALPDKLHWFKWEAYTTWISGFLLLCVIYYLGAEVYLIDASKQDFTGWQAVAIGLGCLAGGWILYDGLCRSPIGRDAMLFGIVWFAVLTAATYALVQIFSDRGAFIHIGAVIGTVMVANVFMVIIPNQRKAVAAMIAGDPVDPKLGREAKQRSLHNNYMTLPVLFIMISNHYPMVVGHQYNWLLLAGIGIISWMIRHFFNLKHKGEIRPELAFGAAAGFAGLMLFASQDLRAPDVASGESVRFVEVQTIVNRHCVTCHSANPTHAAFPVAPANLMLDSPEAIRTNARAIYDQTVATQMMPLGNETKMTAEERQALGRWITTFLSLR